jgi:hypothetical protein
MVVAIFTAAIGLMMFALGRWGTRQAAELVPPSMSEAEREKRVRVYRRGAVVLQAVGLLFLAAIVVGGADLLLHG